MKLKMPKDWYEQRIPLEGDSEIGAGSPQAFRKLLEGLSPERQARIKKKIAKLAKKLAGKSIAEFRRKPKKG